MQRREYAIAVGGKKITAEFTDLAERANGSVLMRSEGTAVLVTAVMEREVREGVEKLDFVPLTVDYEERFYAARTIGGGSFVRREGKPSDEATLTSRAIDRCVRPLFDGQLRNAVQVVVIVLSLGDTDPDILAMLGASLALGASDIPWGGPVSATRILQDAGGSFLINPHFAPRKGARAGVVVCGNTEGTVSLEASGNQVEEGVLVDMLEKAQQELSILQEWQKDIIKKEGKEKQKPPSAGLVPEHLARAEERTRVRAHIVQKGARPDGRAPDALRPLYAQRGGFSAQLHGSGIFYRGGTHVFSALTLGDETDAVRLNTIEQGNAEKYFFHHYNAPPFGSGETGRLAPGRRSIGHGALVERALLPVIPTLAEFPRTIRLVSEALSSDGSTSMASVCAATLALQDGKVPITAPVAGIAMGLVEKTILTDMSGAEDHAGDMDMKVAGTRRGVTALQMDAKVQGIPVPLLSAALAKAKSAREKILDVMESASNNH